MIKVFPNEARESHKLIAVCSATLHIGKNIHMHIHATKAHPCAHAIMHAYIT